MEQYRKIVERLDRHILFNPLNWPGREMIGRVTALVLVAVFLYMKFTRFDLYPGSCRDTALFYRQVAPQAFGPALWEIGIVIIWVLKLLTWSMETAILFGYIASYMSREKAVSVAGGVMETLFPIAIAGLPVLISFAPYNYPKTLSFDLFLHYPVYLAIYSMIFMGGIINFVGLLTLRRAFTIMTEARCLVTTGIFSRIRHPLYLGHFIIFLGSTLIRLHWYTVVLYLVFVCGQVVRARLEEKKLEYVFKEYESYRLSTGMFFPRLFGRCEKL